MPRVTAYFEFDRSDADWASSARELDDYWRKRVKNEALGLILADKNWEEARDTLDKRYDNFRRRVLQVNSEDVFEMFINSYVQTLDPHTSYFSPRDSEEFEIRMSLSYEGIGASLQVEDEYVSIVRVLPGGSAYKADVLKPNDRITGVAQGTDDKFVDVVGWRLDDVVDLIRGPKDSLVRLQILPAGAAPGSEEKVVELVRSEIKLEEQAAQAEVIEHRVAEIAFGRCRDGREPDRGRSKRERLERVEPRGDLGRRRERGHARERRGLRQEVRRPPALPGPRQAVSQKDRTHSATARAPPTPRKCRGPRPGADRSDSAARRARARGR